MRNSSMILTGRAFVAVLAFTLASAPVLANKPDWSGGFKTIKNDKDIGVPAREGVLQPLTVAGIRPEEPEGQVSPRAS